MSPRLPAGATLKERLLFRIEYSPTGCWLWRGALDAQSGYGRIQLGNRTGYAHRVSYEEHVGAIPPGKQLDHLCRVRSCVNPSHLEPVTPRENCVRGIGFVARNVRVTHCPYGHEYDEANTLIYGTSRRCRTCRDINNSVRPYDPETARLLRQQSLPGRRVA